MRELREVAFGGFDSVAINCDVYGFVSIRSQLRIINDYVN